MPSKIANLRLKQHQYRIHFGRRLEGFGLQQVHEAQRLPDRTPVRILLRYPGAAALTPQESGLDSVLQSLQAFQTPCLMPYLDWGFEPARQVYCLVLDTFEGITLSHALTSSPKPWPLARLYAALEGLFRDLDRLHQAGFCHGQLNPESLLLCGSRLVAWNLEIDRPDLDLHPIEAEVALRRCAELQRWHLPYQAPAWEKGPALDHFSLGAVAYRMLTGSSPYPETLADFLPEMLQGGERQSPPYRPEIAPPVYQWVIRLMEKGGFANLSIALEEMKKLVLQV